MYNYPLIAALLKAAAKKDEQEPPQLSPVAQISAKNQGLDPEMVRKNPGKATDILMQRFMQGKIKKYDPDKDPKWQAMIGKNAAAVGNSMFDIVTLQKDMSNNKKMKEIQSRMPQTSTGIWARQHNSDNQTAENPYRSAELYNKLTHMTHQEDLMPGVGSRSLSLNTRQNITNPMPTYGTGRGTKSY